MAILVPKHDTLTADGLPNTGHKVFDIRDPIHPYRIHYPDTPIPPVVSMGVI
jgi:hypothetical protein